MVVIEMFIPTTCHFTCEPISGHILSRIYSCTNVIIGQLTMQQLHILHWTFRLYNCTNCDQLHVKICPGLFNQIECIL